MKVPRNWILPLVAMLTLALPDMDVNSQQTPTTDRYKIYRPADVYKRPVVDQFRYRMNQPPVRGCKGEGSLIVRAVMRKSGKVTDTNLVKAADCPRFNERALKAVAKIKFKPAQKDGAAVSSLMHFEFTYDCLNAPGNYCP